MNKKFGYIIAVLLFSFLVGQNQSFKASYKTAQRFERKGDFDAALSIYTDLYNKHPNDQRVFRSLLNTYKKSQKYDEGITFLEIQYQKHPLKMQLGLSLFELYFLSGNKTIAYQFLNQLEAQFGHLEPFYRGVLQFYMNRSMETEIQSLLQQTRLDFRFDLFSQELGYYYQSRRVYDRAMDEYILYLSHNPDRGQFISKRVLQMSDEPESVEIIEEKLYQKYEEHERIAAVLADVYFKLQRYQDAMAIHQHLGTTSHVDMNRWFTFANQLQKDLAISESILAYELILKNSSEPNLIGKTLIGLGQSFETQISPAEDVDLIDYYYNDNTFLDTPIHNSSHITDQALKRSIAFYDSVLTGHQFSTQSAQAYYRLGEIHYHVNQNYDHALDHYQSALKHRPGSSLTEKLHLRMVDTYIAKGNMLKGFQFADSISNSSKPNLKIENKRILSALHAFTPDTVMEFISQTFSDIKPTSPFFNDLMELRDLIQNHFIKGEENDKKAFHYFLKADLLLRQTKLYEAVETLKFIQNTYPNASIAHLALFRQSYILYRLGKGDAALESLQLLSDSSVEDRAIILSGQINETFYLDNEKALEHYYRILNDFPESIYFQPVRYHIRSLEGTI